MRDILFPTDIATREWAEFSADGFTSPVFGLIHRGANPAENGMPLGGIDTGCLDLETDGTLGFCSIFCNLIYRTSLNVPLLGLAVGDRTWTLTTTKLHGVECASDIQYWGHYPVADLQYELDSPVRVAMRAWSPFIPGDVNASTIPAAIFEIHLRNDSDRRQDGTVAINYPGTDGKDLLAGSIWHQRLAIGPGLFTGDLVVGYHKGPYPGAAQATIHRGTRRAASTQIRKQYERDGVATGQIEGGASWILGVLGEKSVRIGDALDNDGAAWSQIRTTLPPRDHIDEGTSLAVDFELDAGQHRVVRFVLAWRTPHWWASGIQVHRGNRFN